MPSFFKGTVNLRETRVPVLDLRTRLGLETTKQTTESRIVVVNTDGKDVGFIVDAVTGVLPVLTSSIEPVTVSDARSDYLSGITMLDSRQVLLVDLNKVFSIFNDNIPAIPTDNIPAAVN